MTKSVLPAGNRKRTVSDFLVDARGPRRLFGLLDCLSWKLEWPDSGGDFCAAIGKEHGEWDEGRKEPGRTEGEDE